MDESTTRQPAAMPGNAPPSMPARALGLLTSAFGWLMCTLATGALAAFAGLVAGIRPAWMILILALPLTFVLKLCGCLQPRWAAPVAVLAIALAGFYAACLAAIARIAATTGFPFGEAFRTGGVALTLRVAEFGLDVVAILVYAAAAVVAALVATWLTNQPHATANPKTSDADERE